jgi:hypothetical protein
MKSPRVTAFLVPVLALSGALAPRLNAAADSWDDFTYITFTAPVEVPGHALPAGTYLFQVADIWSNQETIQIYNADKTKLYAIVTSIPMYRYEPPPRQTIIQFDERPENTPEALAVWFPRGQRWGHRFVYWHRHMKKAPAQLEKRP